METGPGSRYIEVNSAHLEDFIKNIKFNRPMQFERTVQSNEIVYVLQHHYNKHIFLKIYTSISTQATIARGCGEDAIRVAVVFEKGKKGEPGYKSFGIAKLSRIYRTGSEEAVFQRIYDRMREGYRLANQWIREHGNCRT